MQPQDLSLIAVQLPDSSNLTLVSQRLALQFSKGIEAAYVAHVGNKMLIFTHFHVLTFIGYHREEVLQVLRQLDIEGGQDFEEQLFNQDYPLIIDGHLDEPFRISNDHIRLKTADLSMLTMTALVISQSVGLETFETTVDDFNQRARQLLDTPKAFSLTQRATYLNFSRDLMILRHDMLLDLLLLDKPNILWDDAVLEKYYTTLAESLEIQERFEVVEYKLNHLKEDAALLMDYTSHKNTEFLEWIIIILILIEVVMGFASWFGYGPH